MIRFAIPMLACTSLLCLGACSDGETGSAGSAPARPAATAALQSADGGLRGTATATETVQGLQLSVKLQGLTPGVHGVHVHTIGACAPPDFTTAGGHWNPMLRQHGRDNPQGAHMGDLPNATVAPDGRGPLSFLIPNARIATGADALLDADGATIVVHAGPDDMKTDPSGNSGGRIACGVFRTG